MWHIRDLFVTMLLTVSAINYYSGGKYGAFHKQEISSTDSNVLKDMQGWQPEAFDTTSPFTMDPYNPREPNQKSNAGYCSIQQGLQTAMEPKPGDKCYDGIDYTIGPVVPELPQIPGRGSSSYPAGTHELIPTMKLAELEVDDLHSLCLVEREVWPSCDVWPKRIYRVAYSDQFERVYHDTATGEDPCRNYESRIFKGRHSLHQDCACYVKVFRELLFSGHSDRRQAGLFVALVRKLVVSSAKLALDLQDTSIMDTQLCHVEDTNRAATCFGVEPYEFEQPGVCDITNATLGCILLTSLPLNLFVWLLRNFVRGIANEDPLPGSSESRKRGEFTDLQVLV